jgi:hypothetical protein
MLGMLNLSSGEEDLSRTPRQRFNTDEQRPHATEPKYAKLLRGVDPKEDRDGGDWASVSYILDCSN